MRKYPHFLKGTHFFTITQVAVNCIFTHSFKTYRTVYKVNEVEKKIFLSCGICNEEDGLEAKIIKNYHFTL